jgi:hypothetical protein
MGRKSDALVPARDTPAALPALALGPLEPGAVMVSMFWWMLVAHSLCDYPLQGDFLARGKNVRNPLSGVPWWICLAAHSLIHGGAVALLTNPMLGSFEFGAHWATDYLKCCNVIGFKTDQAIHVVCKALWVGLWWLLVV